MRMSKLEINPEEIDKGTLIAVTVAAVAVAGIALVAVRKGPKDKKTGSHDPSLFENLSKRKPAGGHPNGWHRACVDRPGLLLLQVTIH